MNIQNKYTTSFWYVWTPKFKIRKESKRWTTRWNRKTASIRYKYGIQEVHLFYGGTYMSFRKP